MFSLDPVLSAIKTLPFQLNTLKSTLHTPITASRAFTGRLEQHYNSSHPCQPDFQILFLAAYKKNVQTTASHVGAITDYVRCMAQPVSRTLRGNHILPSHSSILPITCIHLVHNHCPGELFETLYTILRSCFPRPAHLYCCKARNSSLTDASRLRVHLPHNSYLPHW